MIGSKLISVVIPAFNVGKYIDQCLQIILNQSYKHLEIIVVDDGSTDNTTELVKKYPVKLIEQHNQGVSVARNEGMKAATGDYLHFMDADDLINLDFYKNMLASIESVNADVACCNVIHERLPALSSDFREQFIVVNPDDKMYFSNIINQGQVYKYLFRKSLIDRIAVEFLPELRNAQDKVFSIQAIYFSNMIIFCPSAVYFYKHRENSNMTSMSSEKRKLRKSYVKLADRLCFEFAEKHNLNVVGAPLYTTYRTEVFGLPLWSKRIYQSGRKKWRLFNVTILHRKV